MLSVYEREKRTEERDFVVTCQKFTAQASSCQRELRDNSTSTSARRAEGQERQNNLHSQAGVQEAICGEVAGRLDDRIPLPAWRQRTTSRSAHC